MKKILFVVPRMCFDRPREVRSKHMIELLPLDYEIHLLTFNYGQKLEFKREVKVHYVDFGWISKFVFNQRNFSFPTFLSFFRKGVAFILRNFFFPDIWKVESGRLIRNLERILKNNDFSCVITSVVPFSMLLLGPTIKCNMCKWLVDLGDPLYKNTIKLVFSASRAFKYEEKFLKKCDALIVTNEATKKHYLETFKVLGKNMVHVVPQGAVIPSRRIEDVSDLHPNKPLLLTYAGTFYKGLREPTSLFQAVVSLSSVPVALNIYPKPYCFSNPCPEKIRFMEAVKNDQIIEKYMESDILVYLDNATGLQSSGKIFELLACRKPILFIYENESSETKRALESYSGLFFAKNNPDAIKIAIESAVSSIGNIEFNFPVEKISWLARTQEVMKIIEEVTE